jgi:hypothetical protein
MHGRLDFMIVVSDAGELKQVTMTQITEAIEKVGPDSIPTAFEDALDFVLNKVLDDRSFDEEIASAAGAD